MGGLCVRHEEPVTRVFPRGRPYVPLDLAGAAAVALLRAERAWARAPVPAGPPGEHAAAGFAGSPGW